jgi:hypothetical protein
MIEMTGGKAWVPRLGLALVCLLVGAEAAQAACNLIPGTEKTFNSALGGTNRPFAAPGEAVEILRRPCDPPAVSFSADPTQHVVTVLFTPPGGTPNAVALTAAADCSGVNLGSCSLPGGGTVTCVDAPTGSGVTTVERDGVRRLRFRFPDTDDALLAADDDVTLSGPVKIAVTAAGQPLPCGLATASCASTPGLTACIDEYFANDGACGTGVPLETFPTFTALPPPNDYAADCFRESPPCTALAEEVRAALDRDGNLLLPVNWQGILVRNAGVPVPRLLRTRIKSPLPFQAPDQVFFGSYTPGGGKLPPIFEPQFDPLTAITDVRFGGRAVHDSAHWQAARNVCRGIEGRAAVFCQCRLSRRRVRGQLCGGSDDPVSDGDRMRGRGRVRAVVRSERAAGGAQWGSGGAGSQDSCGRGRDLSGGTDVCGGHRLRRRGLVCGRVLPGGRPAVHAADNGRRRPCGLRCDRPVRELRLRGEHPGDAGGACG